MENKILHVAVVAAMIVVTYFILRPSKRERRSKALIDCSDDFHDLKRRILNAAIEDMDKLRDSVFDFQDYYKTRANTLYMDYASELHNLISKREAKALKDSAQGTVKG